MNLLRKDLNFTRKITILSTSSLVSSILLTGLLYRFEAVLPRGVLTFATVSMVLLLLLGLILALGEIDFRGARAAVLNPLGRYNAFVKWGAFVVFRLLFNQMSDPPIWLSLLLGGALIAIIVTLSTLIVKKINCLTDTEMKEAFSAYYDADNHQKVQKAFKDNQQFSTLYFFIGLLTILRFEASWGSETIPLLWAVMPVYGLFAFFVLRRMSQWVNKGLFLREPSLGTLQKVVFITGLLVMVVLHLETHLLDELWNRFFMAAFIFSVPLWQSYLNMKIIEMTRYAPLFEEGLGYEND